MGVNDATGTLRLPRPTRRRWSPRSTIRFLIGAVALIVAWEVLVRVLDVPQYLLPAPSLILTRIVENGPILAQAAAISLWEMALAFVVGSAFGFLAAIAIFYSPFLNRGLYPLLLSVRLVPKIAFLPLIVIWLGADTVSKITLAAMAIFFLILVQVLLGLTSIDEEIIEVARSLRMREWGIFWQVRVPSALPAIMVGVKLGVTYALTNVIAAEMLVANVGLGYLVMNAKVRIDTPDLMAAIVVTAAIGLAMFGLARLAERRFTSWWVES